MGPSRPAAPLLALVLLAGCGAARNFPDPAGPRFATFHTADPEVDVVRVVSFNVKYGRNPAGAARLLADDPRLRQADIVSLQEVDERGVECIAGSLRLNSVYYPAALHPTDRRNMGNAVLSPWPIVDDAKLVLPHRNRFRHMLRAAVAATVLVDGATPVRVVSVHLETPGGLGPGARREQAAVVRRAAEGHPRVVVAGDFNAHGLVGEVFAGFAWLTRDVGRTISFFSWDHILARGLQPRDCAAVGVARGERAVSDHRPVFADLVLAAPGEARDLTAIGCAGPAARAP